MEKALFSGAYQGLTNYTNAPIEDVIKPIKDTGVELHIVSPTQELQVEQQINKEKNMIKIEWNTLIQTVKSSFMLLTMRLSGAI